MDHAVTYFHSPLGWLELKTSHDAIISLLFRQQAGESTGTTDITRQCIQQLTEYFAGDRVIFDVPLQPAGSDFQTTVWKELGRIPYGETISYMTLAKRLGDEKLVRAVGAANGRNPIAIIVPCHRVIGASGKLVGYAGELWRKEWLLKHELEFAPKKAGRLF